MAFEPSKDLTNQQTFELMQDGKLVLVDVRTEDEWRASGVAKGALPISMLDANFINRIAQIRQENPEKTIAFICASGMRSSFVKVELVKRGFENIFSVYGGTTGNGDAGWIKDGLPVVKYSAN